MSNTSYKERVEHLLSEWESHDQGVAYLIDMAQVLGCDTTKAGAVDKLGGCSFPGEVIEDVVVDALMKALLAHKKVRDAYITERCILAGLLQKERWRFCLGSEDATYAFAQLVATFSEQTYDWKMTKDWVTMDNNVAVALNEALGSWLSPAYPLPDIVGYDQRSFAAALFGESWYDLVVGASTADSHLATLIRVYRPPFLPGLHRGQQETAAQDLPALGATCV